MNQSINESINPSINRNAWGRREDEWNIGVPCYGMLESGESCSFLCFAWRRNEECVCMWLWRCVWEIIAIYERTVRRLTGLLTCSCFCLRWRITRKFCAKRLMLGSKNGHYSCHSCRSCHSCHSCHSHQIVTQHNATRRSEWILCKGHHWFRSALEDMVPLHSITSKQLRITSLLKLAPI